MKILITGASGFIGMPILERLIHSDEVSEIYALTRKLTQKLPKNKKLKWIETDISEGTIPASEIANQLQTTDAQVRKHMRSHLQPLVQKSAATQIARREIDEIDMLSANLQRLDGKLDELFNMPTHTTRELDSLTKLAKEIRVSIMGHKICKAAYRHSNPQFAYSLSFFKTQTNSKFDARKFQRARSAEGKKLEIKVGRRKDVHTHNLPWMNTATGRLAEASLTARVCERVRVCVCACVCVYVCVCGV